MRKLTEQGHTSADARIKRLLTDIQYLENLYALKRIVKHEGNFVSLETLITAMESLCPKKNDTAYSEEMFIRLEWQLQTVITILQQLRECSVNLHPSCLMILVKSLPCTQRQVKGLWMEEIFGNLMNPLNAITTINTSSKL